jgi:enoyl-CoA hydratase/carnithine racemase
MEGNRCTNACSNLIKVPKFKTINVNVPADGVLVVTYNRPTRKNAFNESQYNETVAALDFATKNDAIRVVVRFLLWLD